MKAVILAGGLGTRLRPFTEAIPKPLLPIGEKSIMEIQIQHLAKYGFNEIYVATNYKADYVESFIGDGKRLGVNITFSKEDKPLGTCGPLTLLKNKLTEPFIVMNGDILTTIDFGKLYEYALGIDSDYVVVTKEIVMPFAFGNVFSDGHYITGIEEKPDIRNEIIAGIYVMKPPIFQYFQDNQYFGMDNLIKKLLKNEVPIVRYLMSEFWLDIGRMEDYNQAQDAYNEHFKD
jgi:NDP-sugar pyrophosphorylase family protein